MQPGPGFSSPLEFNQALWVAAFAVIVLCILTLLLATSVIAHHLVSDRNRRLNRERFEGAAAMLAPVLVAPGSDLIDAVRDAIRDHGKRATGLVLRRARLDLRGTSADRISAVLEEIGVVDELIKALDSRRDWKREHAARGLGECGGERALRALLPSADDESAMVRRAARESLLMIRDPEGIRAAIASFLVDLPRRAGWRRSFYSRLSAVDPLELLRLIRSGKLETPEIKLALEALGDSETQAALSIAAEMLERPEPELRATAARVIGKLDRVEFMTKLTEALNDEAWFVRAAIARSFEWMLSGKQTSRMDPRARAAAVDALALHLADRNWWVRANSSRALAREGSSGRKRLFISAGGTDGYAADAALAALALVELAPEEQERFNRLIEARRAASLSAAVPVLQGGVA